MTFRNAWTDWLADPWVQAHWEEIPDDNVMDWWESQFPLFGLYMINGRVERTFDRGSDLGEEYEK